jgi:hypothetical protein
LYPSKDVAADLSLSDDFSDDLLEVPLAELLDDLLEEYPSSALAPISIHTSDMSPKALFRLERFAELLDDRMCLSRLPTLSASCCEVRLCLSASSATLSAALHEVLDSFPFLR